MLICDLQIDTALDSFDLVIDDYRLLSLLSRKVEENAGWQTSVVGVDSCFRSILAAQMLIQLAVL